MTVKNAKEIMFEEKQIDTEQTDPSKPERESRIALITNLSNTQIYSSHRI